IRPPARQQPLHPRAPGRPLRPRHDARDHDREPRLRAGRVSRTALPRRHVLRRDRGRRAARVEVAARRRDRHLRAPRPQPARRARRPLPPRGLHEEAAGAVKPMAFRRRCLLFVPGDSERKIAHALRLPVDGLVFDLEDAVAPGAKAAARRTVSAALPAVPPGCERVVRVNAVATGLATEDVRGTMAGRPDAYMLPKVRDPTEIVAVARAIAEAEAAHGLPAGQVRLVVIGTETAAGVLAIRELARAHPRVNGLLWGSEDLSADIGARRTHGPDGRLLDVFAHARSVALLAAAAARIDAFDMPYLRIGDTAGLRREAEESAA